MATAERWEAERDKDEAAKRELVRAAGRAWAEWLPTLRPWNVMATLTYDRRRLEGRPSWFKVESDVKSWLTGIERDLGRPAAGALFGELHRDGWPHMHGVLDLGGLAMGDVVKMSRLWFRRAGYNRIEVPRSIGDVAGYCSKYVTKDRLELAVLYGRLDRDLVTRVPVRPGRRRRGRRRRSRSS